MKVDDKRLTHNRRAVANNHRADLNQQAKPDGYYHAAEDDIGRALFRFSDAMDDQMASDCKMFLDRAWRSIYDGIHAGTGARRAYQERVLPMTLEHVGLLFWLARTGHDSIFLEEDDWWWPLKVGRQLQALADKFGIVKWHVRRGVIYPTS